MSPFAPQLGIESRFGATTIEALGRRYNTAPGDDLAVIQNDAGSARSGEHHRPLGRWGGTASRDRS